MKSDVSDHRVEVIEVAGPNYVARCSCGWSSTDWPSKEVAELEGGAHIEEVTPDAN